MTYLASQETTGKTSFFKFAKQFFTSIREARRMARDKRLLSQLPADRLADMGIAQRSEANGRSSGEAGDIPRADLW